MRRRRSNLAHAAAVGIAAACSLVSSARGQLTVGEIFPFEGRTPSAYAGVAAGERRGVWFRVLSHPGATYVAIHFTSFDLAPGDYVICCDPKGEQIHRLEGRGKHDAGDFWAPHVRGDTVVVGLIVTSPTGGSGFEIAEYAAGFVSIDEATRCGPDHRRNAVCYEESHPQEYEHARAVARLLIAGRILCTGWLVSAENHLVTNYHCIASEADAMNTDYEFLAEAPICDAPNGRFAWPGTVYSGATLVHADEDLDVALVRIVTGDPAATFGHLEIDDRAPTVGEQVYVPQHPRGRAKEIAIGSTPPGDAGDFCRLSSIDEPPCGDRPSPDVGYHADTGPGSSGAPVIAASDHRVIALHHCAGCPNRGVPMSMIYPAIRPHLPGRRAYVEIAELAAPETPSLGSFGAAIDLEGDTAIAGADGAASVLERSRDADGWREVMRLVGPGEAHDGFGVSVAISGDTVVVGAPGDGDGGAFNAGAAYVFRRDAGGRDRWGRVARLVASDAPRAVAFGTAVAIDDGTLVIGATGREDGADRGAVYVFDRQAGGVWREVAMLTAADGREGSRFGSAIAIDGDTLLVGASGHDAHGRAAGRVYVFEREQAGSTEWGRVETLVGRDVAAGDGFGGAVAIRGDTAIVGACGEDDGGVAGAGSGAAYVFRRRGRGDAGWRETRKLVASTGEVGDRFGRCVSAGRETVCVGAPGGDGSATAAGAAYVFHRHAGGVDRWGRVAKITDSGDADDVNFGHAVAIDANGRTLLAGAPRRGVGGVRRGSIHVFDRVEIDGTCPADLDGDRAVDWRDLVGFIAAWGTCGAGEERAERNRWNGEAVCPGDVDGDADADLDDLLALLAAWGWCP